MPWIRALLRGQRVFARADEHGRFAETGGKVEIRYKASDGRRYDAMARNLTVEPGAEPLPDDTCAPAEAVPKSDAAKPEGGAAARKTSSGRSGGGTKAAASGAAAIAVRDKAIADAHAGELVVAYTDGACSGNPGPAALGVVVLDGGSRVELGEYLGTGTNNIAELTAILRALELVEDRSRPLLVHTDSSYSIGVLTKGWKAKANVELVASIRQALAGHPQAKLVYVPGHSGVAWNERADELARGAIAARQTTKKVLEGKPVAS